MKDPRTDIEIECNSHSEKAYDCPFCGSKNVIWESPKSYAINYCEHCHKILIVLSNAKSTDFLSELMLKFFRGLKGDW